MVIIKTLICLLARSNKQFSVSIATLMVTLCKLTRCYCVKSCDFWLS